MKSQISICLMIVGVFPLLIVGSVGGQSQQSSPRQIAEQIISCSSNQKGALSQQRSDSNQRGTDQAPFVVKILPTEQAPEKPCRDNADRQKEDGSVWGLSDKIAAIASAASFLQVVALVITIAVMVRTARRQLRAYIFPDNAGLFEGMMLSPPQPSHANEPGVVLTIRNSGKTPAYKVISWAQISVVAPIDENGLIVPPLTDIYATNLGPGGVMSKSIWLGRQLTPSEIADVGIGARVIYLFGRIEYIDAFKRKRFTAFRLQYAGLFPPPQGVIFNFCLKGNDAN